jgi:hypothetical protein
MRLIIEPEMPGDSRSLFRLLVGEKVAAEGMTAAQILDVAQRQRIFHVHHHDKTDDLRRAVEVSERVAHGLKLSRPAAPRAFGLTEPWRRNDVRPRSS